MRTTGRRATWGRSSRRAPARRLATATNWSRSALDVGTGGSMPTFKKVLLSMMVVGSVGMTVGAGTFASFNANVQNDSAMFQTGTIILGQSTGTDASSGDGSTSTVCLSSGKIDTHNNIIGSGDIVGDGDEEAENQNDCGQFFNLSLQKPGSNLPATTGSQIDLTVQNYGNLNATLSTFASPDCSGTLACDAVEFMLQEYSDRSRATPSTCRYGGGTATVCDWDAAKTLSTFQTTDPLSLGAIDKFGGDPATAGVTDIRYFKLSVRLKPVNDLLTVTPVSALNSYQGKTLTMGLAWQLTQ